MAHPGGRPTKRVPTTHARIIKALKNGATHKLAAAAGGIGYSTFTDWMRENPKFSAAVAMAEAEAAEKWLGFVNEAAPNDWRAATWLLERRHPNDYGKTVQETTAKHEHSGPNGQPIQIEHFDANAALAAATSGPGEDREDAGV